MNYLGWIIAGVLVIVFLVYLFLQKREKSISTKSYVHPISQRKEEAKEKIFEEMKKREKMTNDDVQNLLNVSDATATNYLEELEKEGKIVQVGETGRGVYYKIERF